MANKLCYRLGEIERSQSRDLNLFHPEGGYLDFITDSRCSFYCRIYVGQASILEDRIGCHIEKMESGDESTLHYYVKSKGGRHRQANFIRIFHFDCHPDTHIDQDGTKCAQKHSRAVDVRSFPDIAKGRAIAMAAAWKR